MIFQSCSRPQNFTFWVCKSVLGTQRMYSQHQNVFLDTSYEIVDLGVREACCKNSLFFTRFEVQYCVCGYCKNETRIHSDDLKITFWCWEYILWVLKTLLHTQNAKFWRLEQLWNIVKNHDPDFYCILPSKRLKKG